MKIIIWMLYISTRVDHFRFEDGTYGQVGDLRRGDQVRALDDEERPFAVLQVTNVEKRTYGSIDDEIAQIENFRDAKALREALGEFYKDLKQESELVVVHFVLIRSL